MHYKNDPTIVWKNIALKLYFLDLDDLMFEASVKLKKKKNELVLVI